MFKNFTTNRPSKHVEQRFERSLPGICSGNLVAKPGLEPGTSGV